MIFSELRAELVPLLQEVMASAAMKQRECQGRHESPHPITLLYRMACCACTRACL